jgi:hypothetical protein
LITKLDASFLVKLVKRNGSSRSDFEYYPQQHLDTNQHPYIWYPDNYFSSNQYPTNLYPGNRYPNNQYPNLQYPDTDIYPGYNEYFHPGLNNNNNNGNPNSIQPFGFDINNNHLYYPPNGSISVEKCYFFKMFSILFIVLINIIL